MEPVELRAGDFVLRPFRPRTPMRSSAPVRTSRSSAGRLCRALTHVSPPTGLSGPAVTSGRPTTPRLPASTQAAASCSASFDLQNCEAEQGPMVGFWVATGARRRGVAVTAVRRLAQWAFEDLGLPRVRWAAYVGNTRSRRVAERAGFVMEGTARRAMEQRGAATGRLDRVDAARGPRASPRDAAIVGSSAFVGWPYEPITLHTERLLLRPFRDDDAPSLLAYARDPEVKAWDHERTPDLDAALARARARADWSSGTFAAWAICSPDDREVWGGIVLSDVDPWACAPRLGTD